MRILVVAYVIDPSRGSEPGNAWQWASRLVQEGHEVLVVCRDEDVDMLQIASDGSGLHIKFLGVAGSRAVLPLPKPFSTYWRYLIWQRNVVKEVRSRHIECDLAWHLTWGTLILGTPLARLKFPYLFGPAAAGTVGAAVPLRYFGLKDWFVERMRMSIALPMMARTRRSRLGVSRAELVLCANNAALRYARRNGARRAIPFLPEGSVASCDGVELPHMRTQSVLWVGRFFGIKAPRLAIEAFEVLLEGMPNARLTMVGDGPLLKRMREYVADAGLAASIDFTGWLDWSTVQATYSAADVLLFTSLRDTTSAQVLEAAGKGLPVVGCDSTGVPEWLDAPAGHFVNTRPLSGLPSRLGAKLSAVLEAPESDYQEMRKAAHAYSRDHSWDTKLSKVWSELV